MKLLACLRDLAMARLALSLFRLAHRIDDDSVDDACDPDAIGSRKHQLAENLRKIAGELAKPRGAQ